MILYEPLRTSNILIISKALVSSGIQYNRDAVRALMYVEMALSHDDASRISAMVEKYKQHQQMGLARLYSTALESISLRTFLVKQMVNSTGGK